MKTVLLRKKTRFGLGGSARIIVVRDVKKVPFIVRALKKKKEQLYILGGGTNIIADDKGYPGVILHMEARNIRVTGRIIRCDAGVPLATLINTASKNGLAGIETLAGIPGTVGGAVYGNAGAYGNEIRNVIKSVTVFDGGEVRILPKNKCGFGYRESIFKKKKWVILSANFFFVKGNKKKLQKISKDIIVLRLKKYKPSLRCAGSIFKNIPVKSALGRRLAPKLPKERIIKGKIPAGFLLESVGAKGMRAGGIEVARHHGNLIVNRGKGTSKDARRLIGVLKRRVYKKYSITLEEEVRYLGFGK